MASSQVESVIPPAANRTSYRAASPDVLSSPGAVHIRSADESPAASGRMAEPCRPTEPKVRDRGGRDRVRRRWFRLSLVLAARDGEGRGPSRRRGQKRARQPFILFLRSPWSDATVHAIPLDDPVSEAVGRVIVHHSDRLHVGIADRGADEVEARVSSDPCSGRSLPASRPESRAGSSCGSRSAGRRRTARGRRRSFRIPSEGRGMPSRFGSPRWIFSRLRMIEGSATSAAILRASYFAITDGIESAERLPVTLPALKDQLPREPRLGAFEEEELEENAIVVARHAPLAIVIGDAERAAGPGATAQRRHGLCSSVSSPAWRGRRLVSRLPQGNPPKLARHASTSRGTSSIPRSRRAPRGRR